jgi:hypothetical protein
MKNLLLDADTRLALETSILHWTRYAEGHGKLEGFPNSRNCALCKLFLDKDCVNCPVFLTTNYRLCQGSPYEDTVLALLDSVETYTDRKFLIAAQAELDFLQSILDNSTLIEQ